MNRILLKNVMTMFFWLYAVMVLAVPVEDVRQAVQDFRNKDSLSRQQELEHRRQEITREEYNQSLWQKESIFESKQRLDEKKDTLKKLTSVHHRQELVDFIKEESFKKISGFFERLGIGKQLDKFARGEEVTEKDLLDLRSVLPVALKEVSKKLASRIISEEQQRILITFLEKVTNILKAELPERFSIDFVEQGFKLMGRSASELYQNLSQKIKNMDLNISNKNKLFLMILGVNILAILMAASNEKALNYIAYSIFVIDAVIVCFQFPDFCIKRN